MFWVRHAHTPSTRFFESWFLYCIVDHVTMEHSINVGCCPGHAIIVLQRSHLLPTMGEYANSASPGSPSSSNPAAITWRFHVEQLSFDKKPIPWQTITHNISNAQFETWWDNQGPLNSFLVTAWHLLTYKLFPADKHNMDLLQQACTYCQHWYSLNVTAAAATSAESAAGAGGGAAANSLYS